MPLRFDNTAAIKFVKSTALTKLRKLIYIKQHYLAELQAALLIDLYHVSFCENASDVPRNPMAPNRTADFNCMFTLCAREDANTETPHRGRSGTAR